MSVSHMVTLLGWSYLFDHSTNRRQCVSCGLDMARSIVPLFPLIGYCNSYLGSGPLQLSYWLGLRMPQCKYIISHDQTLGTLFSLDMIEIHEVVVREQSRNCTILLYLLYYFTLVLYDIFSCNIMLLDVLSSIVVFLLTFSLLLLMRIFLSYLGACHLYGMLSYYGPSRC